MAEQLLRSDPKKLSPQVYRQIFREYCEQRRLPHIEALLLSSTQLENHVPFYIHCHDFVDYNPIIAFHLFNQPKLLLPIFDEALHEAQEKLRTNPAFIEKHRGLKVTSKPYIKVRLVNLPPLPSYIKRTIGDIRADDETTIIQITGTIVRTGSVRMLEVSKE